MKLTCNKTILQEALAGVGKAVSSRNSLPAVEGILFTTEQNSVTLTGYNFDLVITTQIEAFVEQGGSAVLNAKLITDFVRMSENAEISIFVDDKLATVIKSGASEIKFMAIPAEDFPELPKPSADAALCVNGLELKDMIEKTLYAVSQNEQKPVHMGTKFVLESNKLTLVSVDGYRLAKCTRPVINADDKSFVVPGKSLSEISKLIAEDEGEVYINTARRYAVFYLSKYTVNTRLFEGDFLDYTRAIPEGYKSRVKVDVRMMSAAVERAALIITDRLKSPVKFSFSPEKTVISCVTGMGSVVDEQKFPFEGEDITVNFNNRYILDALRNSGCDEVYFELIDPAKALKIVPVDGEDFLHLVLPITN